ncbi:hypothetical protein BUALT_Bualt16G0079700 [Buddleja alternifolia]|uniref:RING-type domain-containing protein n=1 Tax=Buddleja alternifolia TaxID=168488 RepID=A0AAV6W9Z3_9LAMI|nr:hypothetical protein BUALT_Bualt16G0079700 [Buddleja alternifolia]
MEDFPADLLVNSAEHGHRETLKFPRKNSDLSLGSGNGLISIKTENLVSSGRILAPNENPAHRVGSSNVEPGNERKQFSESRELVPSHQNIANSRGKETASTSYVDQASRYCVSANEMSSVDPMNGIKGNMNTDSSQNGESLNNSSARHSHGRGESLLDEVSVENNVSEEMDFSNSDYSSSSFVSNSPVDWHSSVRDDNRQEAIPSGLGFLVSEREQNRQDRENLLHVDVVSISSNSLSPNSAELSSREARRNSRRLFWDAFSRRDSRRRPDSRSFAFSPGDYDHMRSHDRWLLDFSGGLLSGEIGEDSRSHSSRTQQSNEQRLNSRSEIWDRIRGNFDSTNHPTAACPRGVHADGSCSCQPSSSAEESGGRAGISRIVMLAEALFEVLDQIHQQPMSLSLSMVSLPAPESVVDSFPVKTYTKTERPECTDAVSQCYICLAEYEDEDKIRVLPCHHEYHMSCVDKWLKEIHGVCPLCRGDVREGFTDCSTSN